MKKLLVTTITLSLCLTVVGQADATINQQTKELRKDVREEKKELRQEMKDDKKEMRQNAASGSAKKASRVHLMNADLTAINGTTLTVTKDGKTLTITTDANTKFRRMYGGASTIAEMAVGNKIDISGMYSDEAKTVIAAKSIRDRSIMKHRGAFLGEVVSISGNTIVVKTKNKGNQTITVDAATKYVGRNQEPLTLSTILTGHKLRAKGVWDKSNNTITQVTQIKDFSLPAKVTTP